MSSDKTGYMHCYRDREDLTKLEKAAISHYRDLTYAQLKWDWDIGRVELGDDCHMVNNIMRGNIPRASLTRGDKFRSSWIINRVTSAINKSPVTQEFDVIRGVEMFDALKDVKVADEFDDNAFTSFTTSQKTATSYAGRNSDGELIFLSIKLKRGDFALYVDNVEEEWLLSGHKTFKVVGIEHRDNHQGIIGNKAIIYYLAITT